MRILVIGQAPPSHKQQIPYDSTMLYDWLNEIGINKEKAQEMFDWEAIYDKFPGFAWGGHAIPTKEQMDRHWEVLEPKIQAADKVWVLGNVARDYIESKDRTWGCNVEFLYTMHPSRRNFSLYQKSKTSILNKIASFISS